MHLSFHLESKINNYNNITESNIHNQTRISAHLYVQQVGTCRYESVRFVTQNILCYYSKTVRFDEFVRLTRIIAII